MSPTTAAVASSPKLLDRVRWQLRVKHYSIRTEQAYVDWIRRYILFHRKRHPNEMSEKEITELLTHLAVEKASPHPLKTRLSALCCFFTTKCSIENSISSTTSSGSRARRNCRSSSRPAKRAGSSRSSEAITG